MYFLLITTFYADKSSSNTAYTNNDIERIIRDLDPNKAHGHAMMSIHSYANPVDTGLKLNVHKTFSLRPVSIGKDFWRFYLQTLRAYLIVPVIANEALN